MVYRINRRLPVNQIARVRFHAFFRAFFGLYGWQIAYGIFRSAQRILAISKVFV